MRFRSARLAAIALVIAGVTTAGCRRAPLAESGGKDAAPDLAAEAPLTGDGPDAALDTAGEPVDDDDAGPTDGATELGNGDASVDSPSTADAPADMTTAADVPADMTTAADAPADMIGVADRPADRSADLAAGDAPGNDAPTDHAGADASDVRPEDQPCGPLGFRCTPFACDVPRGVCKTTCASDDDCASGWPCRAGSCGLGNHTPCSSNAECNSGFCAQGVCCQSACNAACRSCALPGAIGTCTPVASGAPDPTGFCPAGAVCDGLGLCRLPTACTTDTDCGPSHWCTDGRCVPCAATCASNADCLSNYCVMRNLCTYCDVRDAGAG